jgi:hypothetical protein
MWINAVESVDYAEKNDDGFGCVLVRLLAASLRRRTTLAMQSHEMGLGKSLQVLTFCEAFLRPLDDGNRIGERVLLLTPANTLFNWSVSPDIATSLQSARRRVNEHKKWLGHLQDRYHRIFNIGDSKKKTDTLRYVGAVAA